MPTPSRFCGRVTARPAEAGAAAAGTAPRPKPRLEATRLTGRARAERPPPSPWTNPRVPEPGRRPAGPVSLPLTPDPGPGSWKEAGVRPSPRQPPAPTGHAGTESKRRTHGPARPGTGRTASARPGVPGEAERRRGQRTPRGSESEPQATAASRELGRSDAVSPLTARERPGTRRGERRPSLGARTRRPRAPAPAVTVPAVTAASPDAEPRASLGPACG